MKTIVLEHPKEIRVQTDKQPVPGPGEALIKVRALGICGTDVNAYSGSSALVEYPLIPGHEAAGEIVTINANEKALKPGDRVIIDPYIYCGECISCLKGQTNACRSLRVLGVQTGGAMREWITHPEHLLHPVPANLPWEHIPLAEPLTVSLHSLHRGGVREGETVAIFGAGAIGLLASLAAAIYGARPILIDPLASRLEKAKSLGIKDVIDVSRFSAAEEISRFTGGRMADVVIEASGAAKAISQIVEIAAYTGRVVLVGWPKAPTMLDTALITRKELTVLGSRNSAGEFDEALRLLSEGAIKAEEILTEVVSFDGLPAAFAALCADPADYLKVVAVTG